MKNPDKGHHMTPSSAFITCQILPIFHQKSLANLPKSLRQIQSNIVHLLFNVHKKNQNTWPKFLSSWVGMSKRPQGEIVKSPSRGKDMYGYIYVCIYIYAFKQLYLLLNTNTPLVTVY